MQTENDHGTNEGAYQKLATHLDRLPGGFPPSDTGAEISLLKHLFTPQEAALATCLTLDPEDAGIIAARAGLAVAETEQRLNQMAQKGLIFAVQPPNRPAWYQAVPFIVGIYELQVNNLSQEVLQALATYWNTRKQRPPVPTIPQLRTIPVHQSIDAHLETLPYEQAHELVRGHRRYAVAPCICRRRARLTGAGCRAPEESCLIFDEWAEYYLRTGRGRAVELPEVMQILERADAANLVLQPSNSKDIAFLCCCCGCCCGILKAVQQHPRPADVVASPFRAQLDPEACQGCWTCLDRCPMSALAREDGRVALSAERCIGCGLCVSTCPSGALTLQRRSDRHGADTPANLNDTWRIISQAQAQCAQQG
jgi:Fe-S-cluster-containing hydrogenase component 2